jgi:Xaa-Pro aminopeptidase
MEVLCDMRESGNVDIYRSRLVRCQKLMSEREIDALFLALGPNMYYLSGFLEEPGERLLSLIVPRSGEPLFIVPQLYEQQVKALTWVEKLVSWKDSEDPNAVLSATMRQVVTEHATIAVDTRMWSRFLLMLLAALPDARFLDAASVMNVLRIKKTPEEIALMVRAAEIADTAFTETVKECREGMTEHQVAAKIVNEMRIQGADSVPFEPITGSGPNGALPHYRSGDRKLQRGDLVVLDYGCIYRGYFSDITRTIVVGSCDDERKKVYSIVRSAQEKAYQAAVEGIEAQSVDNAARKIIEAAGYGQFFIHRTGHGIGLEVHEDPYIVAGNSMKLDDGMAFSIEPGIYLPGKFGVRIEDIVVIQAGKAQRLNKCTRELVAV